jgi:peptidoglycan/xylan/chitin deacetylase (PgdA/CDA1 family)
MVFSAEIMEQQGKKLYRPPFGLVTQEQMAVLDKHGYTVVAWSVDSMDWYFDNPEDIARCVIEAIHPGAIILLHSAGGKDNRTATIEALPVIIENLKSQGYKLVTVNELIKAVQ